MAHKVDIAAAATPGLVSIVIPCTGMLEYTKLCVPSLLKHSRAPFELIFLDIGSLDGTAEFLAGLQMGLQGKVRIEIVHTPTDLGIGQACRDALARAQGEYIVLLNNDTVVTPSWLNLLIGLATMTTAHGLVGPMSNYAVPPQWVESVPYRVFQSRQKTPANPSGVLADVAAIEKFAVDFHKESQGNWLQTERLGGFCLLCKREVLQRIGPALEEWTDLSLFDSDILSAKARQLDYSLAVCRDLFIHHFGTRTFAQGAPQAPVASARV
jgi:GT2 family glycosyltransferase